VLEVFYVVLEGILNARKFAAELCVTAIIILIYLFISVLYNKIFEIIKH
jgi:hypothetical protein